jgi:hypothetical protein
LFEAQLESSFGANQMIRILHFAYFNDEVNLRLVYFVRYLLKTLLKMCAAWNLRVSEVDT